MITRTNKRLLLAISLLITVICGSVFFSYADIAGTTEISLKIQTLVTTGLGTLYNIINSVVVAIGALALAFCAFQIWLGGEKGIDKAKSCALYVLSGIVIVLIAPLIANFAFSLTDHTTLSFGTLENSIPILADISAIYNMFLGIALPCCCIAIVYGGIQFFGLDLLGQRDFVKQAQMGKLTIKMAIISMLALILLPSVVYLACSSFSIGGWKPVTSSP